MTKFLFLLPSFLLLLTPAKAAFGLPVIINRAEISVPWDDNDQDYLPSDPTIVNTTEHIKTYGLEESFNPIVIGRDENSRPIFGEQTIDQVNGDINLEGYSNTAFELFNYHVSNRLPNPYATVESINRAHLSYRLNSPLGATNLARRSIPAAIQKCFIGQRLVSAVTTLGGLFTVTTVDTIVTKSPRTVRLSELAYFFRNEPMFSTPGTKCTSTTPLSPLSAVVSSSSLSALNQKYSSSGLLDSDTYDKLITYGIELVDDNSLGMHVTQCDLNDAGVAVSCKEEDRSIPRGSGPAGTGQDVMSYILPASAKIIKPNYDNTSTGEPSIDRPNPISFLASFFKLFCLSCILEQTTTYSGPTQITFDIDNRLTKGLSVDSTANIHLQPQKVIESRGLLNLSGSSTNGRTLDPGYLDQKSRESLKNLLYPRSWQK
ncbi:hypothetical protein A3K55_01555 [Candidatus Shapirobacteria bacterium RBG_13_44_7]|uniref:Uncharacterized protein n=1 Tax=Candidatus Shapirobacteria bacterium RBG_13_44_7 TaxID=1802149 RepID=A0A1F7SEV8_9BACT|nr:MAG: hypothetical protein A3K55_01555 [Candidatus Shapirobacteria bacterium RBG_13_44_7]